MVCDFKYPGSWKFLQKKHTQIFFVFHSHVWKTIFEHLNLEKAVFIILLIPNFNICTFMSVSMSKVPAHSRILPAYDILTFSAPLLIFMIFSMSSNDIMQVDLGTVAGPSILEVEALRWSFATSKNATIPKPHLVQEIFVRISKLIPQMYRRPIMYSAIMELNSLVLAFHRNNEALLGPKIQVVNRILQKMQFEKSVYIIRLNFPNYNLGTIMNVSIMPKVPAHSRVLPAYDIVPYFDPFLIFTIGTTFYNRVP